MKKIVILLLMLFTVAGCTNETITTLGINSNEFVSAVNRNLEEDIDSFGLKLIDVEIRKTEKGIDYQFQTYYVNENSTVELKIDIPSNEVFAITSTISSKDMTSIELIYNSMVQMAIVNNIDDDFLKLAEEIGLSKDFYYGLDNTYESDKCCYRFTYDDEILKLEIATK